jgi:hypothetical protein
MAPTLSRACGRQTAGATIIEVVLAGAIVALFLGSLFVLNSTGIGIVKAHRETAAANLCLQDRLEQARASNWSEITDPNWIKDQILQAAPPASSLLRNLEEQITVSPYPPPVPAVAATTVQRLPSGQVNILSQMSATTLSGLQTVRLDFRDTWRSAQNSRTRIRETSTILALGGIGK